MCPENRSKLLILALGCCFTLSLASPRATVTTTTPLPKLQGSTPSSLDNSTVECAIDYFTCNGILDDVCRCDQQLCTKIGDCCAESQYTHNTTGPEFACLSTSVLGEERNDTTTYWMIVSCPTNEFTSAIVGGVANLCTAESLSSPPVSDNRTGLVYRNRYCAQCNGVPDKEQVSWRSQWRCNNTLQETFNTGKSSIDVEQLLNSCNVSMFVVPGSLNPLLRPRTCSPRVIYTCQPPPGTDTSTAEYRALSDLCKSQLVDVRITESTSTTLYKNEFCALCSTFGQGLNILCPLKPDSDIGGFVPPPLNTFAIFLDIAGSGTVVIARENIVVTSTVEQSCGEGQVFDVYSNVCHDTLCQPGYIYNGTCLLLSLLDSNCTLIALNDTEYETISNQVIYWTALEQNVSVQGYNSEGNPIVCTNFTSNFTIEVNETITRPLYGYPEAFGILSYLGLSVDVVAATILLFTYAVFADLRTFYGKLFMNFVLVLLLGDVTFLLGTAVYAVSLEDLVCQVVAILLHYLFLARFVWMSLLSLNVARHFYHAAKFIVSEEGESWHYLILYMAAGWLSPLLVLLVTVPLNYAIPGTVEYGVNGLCWMNQTLAISLCFIAPLAICILFTTGAFIFVCIVLMKLHSSCVNREDPKHKTGSRNCRVLVAIFCVTGVMWLFGFLALIDPILSWAWYIFIILNTTQAVFLTLAYMCTAKVLQLYRNAVKKAFRKCLRKRQATVNVEVKDKDVKLSNHQSASAIVTESTIVEKVSG